MIFDDDIIYLELDRLKDMIRNGKFKQDISNNFVYDYELEDEYSHDEIRKIQEEFANKVREYLLNKHPGEYALWIDYCVHISTANFYKTLIGNKNSSKFNGII